MMLKLTSGILRTGWWILLVLLVLVALYIGVGRILTWSVAANQESVRNYLRENDLEFIELGDIEDRWRVHDPGFVVRRVSIKPNGVDGIEVDELAFRVDSLESILQGALALSEVRIAGLRFGLQRDERGLWIKGFDRGNGKLSLKRLTDLFSHMKQMSVADVMIDIDAPGTTDIPLQLVSNTDTPLRILNNGRERQVYLPLYLRRKDDSAFDPANLITLRGYYHGVPGEHQFSADLFLEAPDLNLVGFLPDWKIAGQPLATARLKASSWLVVKNEQVDITADLELSNIATIVEGLPSELLDRVNLTVRGRSLGDGIWQVSVPSLHVLGGNLDSMIEGLSIAIDGKGQYAARVPSLGVEELVNIADYAGQRQLVGEGVSTALESLKPGGHLKELAIVYGDQRARLTAQVVGYSMRAYLGVPAIDRLDGFLSLSPEKGYLDINNEAFNMTFRAMFPAPWSFDSGRGRVAYQRIDDAFLVTSGLIELKDADVSAYGKLNLKLPGDRMQHTWGLTIGVRDADLLEADRYIPNTIPEDVASWLTGAIQGGQSVESGLTFHGALFRQAPAIRKSHDLYFKARNTLMAYHPEWPAVEAASGTVHVTSYFVRSDDLVGRVYGSDIVAGRVDVPVSPEGKADTILIDARAQGPFSDGIRVLQETPLGEITSHMAAEWSGTGRLAGRLALNVPVGDRKDEEVYSDVNIEITDALLSMPDYDLQIDALAGDVRYSNETGLVSTGFTGSMFNHPVTGNINSLVHGDGGEVTVQVDGHIDVPDLYKWSGQILLSRAEGELAYEARVHVPYGGQVNDPYVEATTDLAGVVVNLPYPLSKPEAASQLPLTYQQLFKEDGYVVDINLDDSVQASLKIEDGIATGGRIHFGREAFGAVTYDGIRMTGSLDTLVYQDWMEVTDQLARISEVSIEDEINKHVELVSLNIDKLWLYDLELDQASAVVTRRDDAWQALLSNEMLEGEITVPDDDVLPIQINLETLRLSSDEEEGDPLGDVNPLEIADLNFATDQLLLDGEDYGAWQFHFRARDSVARFEDLTGSSQGVRLETGSLLEWSVDDGIHNSHFKGDIRIDNLAAALKQFGYASSVEGQDMHISTDMSWPGSPAMVNVESVTGQVDIHKGKGRFVQAETGGALKLLGIFDFASIARRFRLDFSDVLEKGFEFKDINGVATFDKGGVNVRERIVIEGTSGRFTVGGSVDLKTRMLDNDMIVTLPFSRTLPWYAAYSAIATGPLAGVGVLLAQFMFENQIDQMSSAKYKISGTIDKPDIEFVAIFDDKVRESEPGE